MMINSSPLIDAGILRENTPTQARLQFWSRVSWPARIGLAIPAAFGLFILWMVAKALVQGGIQNTTGAIVATVAGAVFLVGPYLAARWTWYGLQLILTPERLVVKRHWTRGGKVHDLALAQVQSVGQFESAITIASPWHTIEVETVLTPEQRAAVVDFVRQVIENHLRYGAGVFAKATGTGDLAGSALKDAPALECRYRQGLVVPLFESIGCLALAAICAYMALHNRRGIDLWHVVQHIRMSRGQATVFFWAMAGLFVIFAIVCAQKIYVHFTRPGRLVLRPDRLELYKDGTGTVLEILYRDVQDLSISPHDGTQLSISIEHPGGTLDVERKKLPRSSDFEVVRDAITAGVERNRAADSSLERGPAA